MFKLKVSANAQSRKENTDRPQVDWEALNAHVIEQAKTEKKKRSLPGIISGIIDLGEQEREDAKQVFAGTEEDRLKIIAEYPQTYFEEGQDDKGNDVIFKRWPQKPVQAIGITVDFPQILVNKKKFIEGGEGEDVPLRLPLNGEFSVATDGGRERIVGRMFNLTEKKHDNGKWGFAKNSIIHQLAEAAELLDENGLFTKDRVGELLGKAAQFEIRVYMKESKKDKTKSFFTEEIALAGLIPEGVPVPEFDQSILYGINVDDENDPDALKQLRVCFKNTIKRAVNYQGSVIQKEFGDTEKSEPAQQESNQPAPDYDTFDDSDIPF